MITVTAAIIEKEGRILAARKKTGLHLAGYWEFPGGKVERDETPEECLQRELTEEFGITSEIGCFLAESIYDYGSKIIRLMGYHAQHISGEFRLTDHDEIRWLPAKELDSLIWAPADIPFVDLLQTKYITEQTLSYYNSRAADYISETINLDMAAIRETFMCRLPEKAHILDVGCGSGRDSRVFLDRGYTVTAIDASETVAELTSAFLSQPVLVQKAQEIDGREQYDAIWACASLVHVPDSELCMTCKKIADALKPGGTLYMSFKRGTTKRWDTRGRFFNNCTIEHITEILAQIPHLKISEHYETVSLFPTNPERWLNILAQKALLS